MVLSACPSCNWEFVPLTMVSPSPAHQVLAATVVLSASEFSFLKTIKNFFIVVQLQVSPFSSRYSPPLYPPPPPTFSPPPTLSLSMGPLYMFLVHPSPSLPPLPPFTPFWLLSACSLFPCLWFCFACLRNFCPSRQHGWNWRALC